ncbi:MAG: hypothetical protein AMXMBFR56_60540 [Polyangiaceae bacterium]
MANGHARQDALLQVDGGVRHPPTEAGGAESALFAGEGDELGVAALATDQMQTPVLETPAAKVLLELLHHEARQSAVLLRALEERRPVLRHRLVEHGPLRPVAEARALGLCERMCRVAHATAASASGVPAR